MKIIVTGSLGNISKPLTNILTAQGHAVTVISSDPAKQPAIEALGAKAAIGHLQDVAFLTDVFTGADAVYSMVPPPNYFDHSLDLQAYCSNAGECYATAIEQSGVKRLVHLSSVGAHMSSNSGIILYHRETELILDRLKNTGITFMRPVAFNYNLYAYAGMVKQAGMIATNYGTSKIPWVAPADIATAIAAEIVLPLAGRKVRYVASEELTGAETASILGEAIGKPDLKWVLASDEQALEGLQAAGMNPSIAADLVEMYASLNSGELSADYFANRPAELGKIKMKDFAVDFAAAVK